MSHETNDNCIDAQPVGELRRALIKAEANGSAVGTLLERSKRLPPPMRRGMTDGRRREMARHASADATSRHRGVP